MLTTAQFSKLFPNCKDPAGWVDAMNEVFPKYGIDTPKRIASFVAQCGHESGGWRVFSENLNYSAKSLDAVFGKYFVRAGRNAEDYARQPEKIAHRHPHQFGSLNHAAEATSSRSMGPDPRQMTPTNAPV